MRYDHQPGNVSTGYYRKVTFNARKNNDPLKIMSEEQWRFWKENGYVIIPDAVPRENINRLINIIWEFEEKDPKDPATWYRPPLRKIMMKELEGSGMVELYNHQFLWDNRQQQKIYELFTDIWGTEKLWVSIDRVNLNFPVRGDEFKGFIHWDIDTSDPNRGNNVQGVLSLNDTSEETGGFQCIPELFRNFDEWVKTQPSDRDPFNPDISRLKIEKINTKAGDMLIWNSILAHGIGPNRSDRPRIAQYIAMTPAQENNTELREWRVRSWRERLAPDGYAFPGDPRNWEQQQSEAAKLTELGKKLLGLKDW